MKEQHPIDELFARGLRDAEAAPSAAVWEGIVQKRGWAHLTLVQLRRRWGWLALMLFLGGSATYIALQSSGAELAATQQAVQIIQPILMAQDVSPTTSNTVVSASFSEEDVESTRAYHATTNNEQRPSAPGHGQQADGVTEVQAASIATGSAHLYESHASSMKAPKFTTADVLTHARSVSVAHGGPAEQEDTEKGTSTSTDSQLATEEATLVVTPALVSARELRYSASEIEPIRPGMLQVRSSILEHELLAADLRYGNRPEFRGPRRAWWVAATAGQFRETRTWHGGDADLVKALQGTETPHHTFNFGALAGMNFKGGWGMATGLEYSAARYDFRHLDQFSSMQDSLVTYVITFNSQVVDSYVDTLTTFTEVCKTVAAVNHYTSLRVPLEGSWHKAWRRWHFGVRGGLGLEFNTMRSGVTLMSEQGGTRSVDVSSTEKRTAVLLSGGLAADVGYAINERLAVWASPGYATGLFSLSPTDGTPYAVPERMGIRFRLAYTLRPSR